MENKIYNDAGVEGVIGSELDITFEKDGTHFENQKLLESFVNGFDGREFKVSPILERIGGDFNLIDYRTNSSCRILEELNGSDEVRLLSKKGLEVQFMLFYYKDDDYTLKVINVYKEKGKHITNSIKCYNIYMIKN